MTGISAGKTWSRIGAEVAPTSSAASGVWQIGEVAENVGAGTWPAPPTTTMEIIDEGVLTGTSTNILLTSIPQNFTHLELLFMGKTSGGYGSTQRLQFNDDTGSPDNNYGDGYGYWQKHYNYNYAQGFSTQYYNTGGQARTGRFAAAGTGDPAGSMGGSKITIYNYSNTTQGKNWTYWSGSPGAVSQSTYFQWGGGYWSKTEAIVKIDASAWGDTMQVGTTWQLSGYG